MQYEAEIIFKRMRSDGKFIKQKVEQQCKNFTSRILSSVKIHAITE
jgi:hypothetical protein